MPKMTNRVRNIAIVMAVLGFLSLAIRGNVAGGAMNAAIWFGIVYVVFLLAYGLRKVTRRGSPPPPAATSDVQSADSDKREISSEP